MAKELVATACAAFLLVFAMSGNAEAARLVAHVDLSSQTMTVSEFGRVRYVWRVSTARRGYVTPRGRFRPTRLARTWYSRKYHHSPMPFSVFFYRGYAIHGTYSTRWLGRPASHGCVRLLPSHAAIFFEMVEDVGRRNTRIVVTR